MKLKLFEIHENYILEGDLLSFRFSSKLIEYMTEKYPLNQEPWTVGIMECINFHTDLETDPSMEISHIVNGRMLERLYKIEVKR